MPEISEDGLTYTIKMKEGTKWSDGKPVKASDFVFAWKRAVPTQGYYTQFIWQYIDGTSHMVKDKKTGAEVDTPYTTMDELKDFGSKSAVSPPTATLKSAWFPPPQPVKQVKAIKKQRL